MGLNEVPSNLLAQVDKARLGKRTQADLELEQLFFRPNSTETPVGASSTDDLEWRKKFAELQGKSLTERELQVFLEDVPWGKIARDGTGVLVPLLTGIGLGKTLSFEQTQQLIETAFPIGAGALSIASLCAANERLAKASPKTAKWARIFTVGKVISAATAQAGLMLTVGAFGGGSWHAQEMANAARALKESDNALNDFFGSDIKAAPSDGQGAHFGGAGPDDRSDLGRNFGGLSPDERGEVVGQPPADQPSPAADWSGVDEQLKVQAQAQAEAAKQAALEARQQLVNSLPHNIKVADLLPENQVGTSHWKLAELWTKPLGDNFGLSEAGKTFFTDAVKDMTQNQENIKMDTVVSYDKQQIGDYLAQAVARLKETDPAGWQVKVSQGDLERLTKIAELLKNAK